MILLDPDLDNHPAPAKRGASKPASLQPDRSQRVPSAQTLRRFLREAQAAVKLRGQVTVLLTTDEAIRKLNREFRGKNKPTDVLSFPALQGPGMEEMAGDLAISVPTALRQAGEQGHPLATEIKVLILHGLLHLAGYDHEADEGQMARRERLLRARLKLPQGLIERVGRGSLSPTLSPKSRRKDGAPTAKEPGAPSSRPPGSMKSGATSARVGNQEARPAIKKKSSRSKRSPRP